MVNMNESCTNCSSIQAAVSLTRLGEGASRSLSLLLLRRKAQ
jgi:hypothetical protein